MNASCISRTGIIILFLTNHNFALLIEEKLHIAWGLTEI